MKILITGSDGMLGHDLADVLKGKHELILTTSKTLDITDKDHVIDFVSSQKPDMLINAAAYTDVDGCEKNQELAYSVNGRNFPKTMLELAENHSKITVDRKSVV